jgi:4-hydroxybenzoate polyprenyltransferase
MEGDRKENCRTLPLVLGVNAARVFAANWLFILVALLIITQIYVLQFGWWYAAFYITALVIVPLILLFGKLFNASTSDDFSKISRQIKWIMLTGIFSMVFFLYYTK